MNYFEESEHHFGHSSANVYIDFCRVHDSIIRQDAKRANKYKEIKISDDVLANFADCYKIRNRMIDLCESHYQFVSTNNLQKFLVERSDFCSKKEVLRALMACSMNPYQMFFKVAQSRDMQKVNYLTSNVKTMSDMFFGLAATNSVKIAAISEQIYNSYIDWVKPQDMISWYRAALLTRKELLGPFLSFIKQEHFDNLLPNEIISEEMERRRIVAEQAQLCTVVNSNNKGIVSKL